MSFRLRVIGPSSVGVVDVFEFFPGEDRTIKLQIVDSDTGCCASLPSNATLKTLTLAGNPNDIVINDGSITVDPSDASIFSANLTGTQTAAMESGEINFSYSSGGLVRKAYLPLGLKKLIQAL